MIQLPGKLLGIDYGRKVIGLATCDTLGMMASPYGLLKRKSKREDFAKIQGIVVEIGAKEIICGIPLPPPGFQGYSQADTVRLWAGRLAAMVKIPIRLWDETLSSEEAERILHDAGQHRERIDDAAAAVILQSYLDSMREGLPQPPIIAPVDK
ncbi:Holliday junction resolvase RuvX [Chloroflexota bacterium]